MESKVFFERWYFSMSAISSLSSLINQYQSLNSQSSSSSSSSSILSALEAEGTATSSVTGSLLDALNGTDSSSASSVGEAVESQLYSKTTALGDFYSDSSSLTTAAGSLYSATQDPSSLTYDNVSNFVDAYNKFITSSSENSEYVKSSDISTFKDTLTNSEDSLSEIGVTINSDGTLSVDEDKLNSALNSDSSSVASTLGSLSSSVKSASSALTSNVLSNYTSAYQSTIKTYTELTEYEANMSMLSQLFDTKA
jgi:flagellar hook-associated protein 2